MQALRKELKERLWTLRKAIKEVARYAEERISYGMPYYGYKGRLVYFQYSKKYIGLYIPPPVIQEFKEELKNYETATATIRFPLDRKLPIDLIKKLIKVRVNYNKSILVKGKK